MNTRNYKHGHNTKAYQSPEYVAWQRMKQRCDPKYPRYDEWGGRGINVCDRWADSFTNFYEDMGNKPSPQHSLDRIKNDKGYNPPNCRWATPKEQAQNRRQPRGESLWRSKLTEQDVITIRSKSTGERGEIARFAKEYRVDPSTMADVINRKNWKHL
jgi:hypothetical protein